MPAAIRPDSACAWAREKISAARLGSARSGTEAGPAENTGVGPAVDSDRVPEALRRPAAGTEEVPEAQPGAASAERLSAA